MYSTLAGFCEPAESVEEAVRREVWEESGVRVGRVVIHSTQPWPFPANLMIGCIGQAIKDGEVISLENDKELENAMWVQLDQVNRALKLHDQNGDAAWKEGDFKLPGPTAIAHQLLKAVMNERVDAR